MARRVSGARLALTVFEPFATPGAGPHHDPAQTALNRLNIPVREVELPPSPVGGIGRFAEWANGALPDCGADDFPARADLGRYLDERWSALRRSLPDGVTLHLVPYAVTAAARGESGWRLTAGPEQHGPFGQVALCLGHQPVRPDPQLRRWRDHVGRCGATLMHAYPSADLCEAAAGWRGRTVAIRGLALSMIDVMRVLTVGLGGRFEDAPGAGKLRYCRSGREPARILPFSLDGIPPAPKPADAVLDAVYDLRGYEVEEVRAALAQAVTLAPDAALDVLAQVLARTCGRVLTGLGLAGGATAAAEWIRVEIEGPSGEHAAMDRPPAEILAGFLDMAQGLRVPSAGYATGQVWRKLQDVLREVFDQAQVPPETASALVGFDEGMKRYSYGPPAHSAAEMLALIEDGLLDLRAVDDPDIRLVDEGWLLSADSGEAAASVMIDAVLAAPDLDRCSAPLVAQLREQGHLFPVAEKLGARVSATGRVLDHKGRVVPGLSLMGRLAIGSIIAADSVNDCFGIVTAHWADAVLRAADQGVAAG